MTKIYNVRLKQEKAIKQTKMIQERIINVLQNKPLIRSEICKKSKLAWSTVFDNLLKLEEKGIVKRYKKNLDDNSRGRPNKLWKLIKNE